MPSLSSLQMTSQRLFSFLLIMEIWNIFLCLDRKVVLESDCWQMQGCPLEWLLKKKSVTEISVFVLFIYFKSLNYMVGIQEIFYNDRWSFGMSIIMEAISCDVAWMKPSAPNNISGEISHNLDSEFVVTNFGEWNRNTAIIWKLI